MKEDLRNKILEFWEALKISQTNLLLQIWEEMTIRVTRLDVTHSNYPIHQLPTFWHQIDPGWSTSCRDQVSILHPTPMVPTMSMFKTADGF